MKNKETLYIIGAGIVGFFVVQYALKMKDEKQSSASGHRGYKSDIHNRSGYKSDVMFNATGTDCGCGA